jgi:hypothetical protein
MTGMYPHTQPMVEMVFLELFAKTGLESTILTISASQVGRITSLSYRSFLWFDFHVVLGV